MINFRFLKSLIFHSIRKALTLIAFSIFFMLFFQLNSQAQIALLRYADTQFDLENYYKASNAYKKAYDKKAKYETAVKIANTLEKFGSYDEAYEWRTRILDHPESTKQDYRDYLVAAVKIHNWEEIDELLEKGGYASTDFPELNLDEVRKLSKKSSNLKLLSVEEINSDASELGISFGKNGNILFTSDRGAVGNEQSIPTLRLDAKNNIFSKEKSNYNEREFYKIYSKNPKGEITVVNSDLQNVFHISDPHYYPEKDLVFYTAFVAKTKVRGRKDIVNHAGIYFGKIDDSGNITNSKAFTYNEHLSYGVMNPFVDKSSKRLYFASDMPGGYGGFDLYYSEFDDNFNFSKPVNLGPIINTPHSESHPFIHDNQLYFSSRGHVGFGGMDIFVAEFSNGNVNNLRNMGIPYNSTRDDFFFVISEDGQRFLSSDRKDGLGLDDIYTLQELFKVLKVSVEDCKGEPILEYDSYIVDNSGNSLGTELSKEGVLYARLDPESDYRLQISKNGFFGLEAKSFSTLGFEGDTLVMNFKLAEIPYNTKIFADNIYYDFDKSDIKESEKQTLENIAALMKDNPHTVFYVNSHTDSRGTNTYNEKLSERRAGSVKNYLTGLGLSADRISTEWFGEEKLVNDCGDGVPCPEANHQMNRRSELILSAYPEQQKQYELPKGISDPCDLVLSSTASDINAADKSKDLPTIYFDFDKSTIRQVHQKELDKVVDQMKSDLNLKITVEGHTDQRGNEIYNEHLSQRRATAVVDYLKSKGISADRIEYAYFGKTRPINDCNSQACSNAQQQENRRTTLSWSNKGP
jgi:outer membrane protein OmpA-like peptidoglycan-associated protein/tetratricopeptide (TPR) repeat protein